MDGSKAQQAAKSGSRQGLKVISSEDVRPDADTGDAAGKTLDESSEGAGADQEFPADGDDDDDDGKRKERRKIEIKFIQNKARRHITFSKRKHGIMKKAWELSVLTGTQVLLLVVSETGLVYTFTTPKLQPLVTQNEGKELIQACLNAPDLGDDYDAYNDEEESGSEEDSHSPSVHSDGAERAPSLSEAQTQAQQLQLQQAQAQAQAHAHAQAHAQAQVQVQAQVQAHHLAYQAAMQSAQSQGQMPHLQGMVAPGYKGPGVYAYSPMAPGQYAVGVAPVGYNGASPPGDQAYPVPASSEGQQPLVDYIHPQQGSPQVAPRAQN